MIAAFDHVIARKDRSAFAIVVLDTASMHRSEAFRRKRLSWLDQRAHVVHLSAYSTDFNLIEISGARSSMAGCC